MARHIELIGPLLKARREALGLTVRQVSRWANVSEKYLYDVERGDRPPPKYDVLMVFGNYLAINAYDLMLAAAEYYNQKKRKK